MAAKTESRILLPIWTKWLSGPAYSLNPHSSRVMTFWFDEPYRDRASGIGFPDAPVQIEVRYVKNGRTVTESIPFGNKGSISIELTSGAEPIMGEVKYRIRSLGPTLTAIRGTWMDGTVPIARHDSGKPSGRDGGAAPATPPSGDARAQPPDKELPQPDRNAEGSNSVPVGLVSSSRDIGTSGVIRRGHETNRLDVLSEEAGRLGRPAYGWTEPQEAPRDRQLDRQARGGAQDGLTPPHQLLAPPKLPPGIVAPQPQPRGIPAPELPPAARLESDAAKPGGTATPGQASARIGEVSQSVGPADAQTPTGTGTTEARSDQGSPVAGEPPRASASPAAAEMHQMSAPGDFPTTAEGRAESPPDDLGPQVGALRQQIAGLRTEFADRIRAQRAELAAHLAAQHAALATLIRSA